MVQGLRASPAGQVECFDSKVPGLALRVTRQGVKSWTLVYRRDRQVRRWTIGWYPALSLADAREKAAEARREIAHGGDPAGEKQLRRQALIVADIAETYLFFSEGFRDNADLAEGWQALGLVALTAWHVQCLPGSRPWGWWRHDASTPLQLLIGAHECPSSDTTEFF
jgi:hypothetical protein